MIRKKIKPAFLTAFILLLIVTSNAAGNDTFDIEKNYRDARFSQVADFLEKKDYNKLTLKEKLLLIECLTRTAKTSMALEKMDKIFADAGTQPPTAEILTTAGILYTSLGRLHEAKDFLHRALTLEKNSPKAMLAEAMLRLYFQEYEKAETLHGQIAAKHPAWKKTNLFLFAGLEIYKASRNPKKLKETYHLLARKHKKINKRHYRNSKANSRIFKKALKGKMFSVTAAAQRVVLPMENYRAREAKKIIRLKINDKTFKVLLDTGNAVGWFIYSRELKEILKAERGGRSLTRMGLETGTLEGYHVLCKSVDFGAFKMEFAAGQYVPKPYPEFFDANLNPVFIRERVVSLDYIEQKLVLSSKESFDKELAASTLDSVKLPWYGYERAFIPAVVNK
ncbi:MAG: hypothetical protein KAW12_01405, partial [Candidatus Aminicenantes bacterium]|nr:hypothetical protein [Candidatus Aminicenantes bacterium]